MRHRHRQSLSRMTSRGIRGGLLLGPAAAAAWFLIDTTDWETSDTTVDLTLFTRWCSCSRSVCTCWPGRSGTAASDGGTGPATRSTGTFRSCRPRGFHSTDCPRG